MKCPNCGIPVPEMPEDATFSETLCDRCYAEMEKEQTMSVKAHRPIII